MDKTFTAPAEVTMTRLEIPMQGGVEFVYTTPDGKFLGVATLRTINPDALRWITKDLAEVGQAVASRSVQQQLGMVPMPPGNGRIS